MSNIFITDIVGSIGIPSNDTQLASATSTFDGILSGVANLTYDRVLGWVEDQAGPDGAEGVRTLNCMVEKFTYLTQECPSETQVDTLGAAIEAALEADASITTIGEQQYHLFQTGAYFLWQRDAAGGFLYPNTTTDDVAVGGHVSPAGKWFDDGDLVLGTDTMSGTERLRVVGGARIEKTDSNAIPGLFVQVATSHPAAQQAQLLDVDVNSIGLDIDSEATSKALINLQPINGNTRGDIAFGTTRTADPASPLEGDVWYNATLNCLRYYDGTDEICMSPGGFGNAFAEGSSDAVSTTSSTTFQQKLRVSVTGIDAGDYLIVWSYSWSYSRTTRDFQGQVQIDDATTIWSHRAEAKDQNADQLYSAGGIYVATLTSGNHDFDIDYRASNGIDTARISQARLAIWRVG